MLRLTAFVLTTVLISFAPAAAQKVSSGEIVEYGVITPRSKAKEKKDTDISTGNFTNYDKLEITDNTSTIRAKSGVVFGVAVKLRGSPDGEVAPIRVVWIYPEPGLKNPTTKEAKSRDAFPGGHRLGETQYYYWTLGEEWTQVPGKWVFQLWQDDRRLVQQAFEVTKR